MPPSCEWGHRCLGLQWAFKKVGAGSAGFLLPPGCWPVHLDLFLGSFLQSLSRGRRGKMAL